MVTEAAEAAQQISIHAPRTGSDYRAAQAVANDLHFNPRSPHGERREILATYNANSEFQSTLPARGATRNRKSEKRSMLISIHAPRTGSDI